MKFYKKTILFTTGLRAGLVIVCFLAAAVVLSGCGSEEKLLSELRMEEGMSAVGIDGDPGGGESGYSEEASGGILGEGGSDLYGTALADAGREDISGTSQGSSVQDLQKTGQSVGGRELSGTESGVGGRELSGMESGVGGKDLSGTGQNTDGEGSIKDLQGNGQSVGAANMGTRFQGEKICVHVCGAVKTPGVYELPAGSRFYEAVEAAGGFTLEACQDYLNMAAALSDGSRLEIPTLEEVKEREEAEKTGEKAGGEKEKKAYRYYTVAQEAGSTSDAQSGTAGGNAANTENSGNASDGLVNINTADIAGLCALPGVGEGRAKAIIEYREKQGGFQKKEDIMQVSGIGEKMYARMEAYLTVE